MILNLWGTWHKYISLTETTSIHCCLVFDKCSFTVK